MKSPSRRLRRLVGASTAALLAVGLAPIVAQGVAQAASTNTPAITVSDQTVIGTGDTAAAGNIVVGSSTVTFNQGDTITVQVAQPGVGTPTFTGGVADAAEMNPNCNGALDPETQSGVGDRRFVAYATTPTASGPTGGTLTLLPGVAGQSTAAPLNGTIPGFCNTQDGGTRNDIFTFTVATTGPGPITIGNIQYTAGRGTGQANLAGAPLRANSATTGPVRLFVFFTNVSSGNTNLTKLNTANAGLSSSAFDSNAWITTITMTGPPKAFAVTSGGAAQTKTISGVTISEKVADAFGTAGTPNNTFCIDIASGNAQFAASSSLQVVGSGLATDLLQSIVVPDSTGPGGTNARVSITIFNNPANVLSSLTLNNLVLSIFPSTVGAVRAILTDCGDQAGPGGSIAGDNTDAGFALPAPFPAGTTDAFGGALSSGTVTNPPLPLGNDGPPGGIGANVGPGTGPAVNDFLLSDNDDFDTI
ncbi:MAG TPA: hypothetical protein VMK16_02415, partial [Acidimicrobiales bacterium]|nr:hypothetical protein [Acidimicrobiales bacterium]